MKSRYILNNNSVLFIFFSAILYNNIFYDSYQAVKAFGFLIITIFILILFLSDNNKIIIDFSFLTALCLYLYFFLHVILSDNAASFYYLFVFLSPVVFFIPLLYKINKNKLSLFLNIILLSSLLYGFSQIIIPEIKRPYSFFGNPIFFGEFICILFPFAIFNLINKKFKIISIINISFVPVILLYCHSRGVLLSFFFSFILLVIMLAKSGRIKHFANRNVIYILIVFIFIVIFTPGIIKTIGAFVTKIESSFQIDNPDILRRVILLKSSIKIFLANPFFGTGPGGLKKLLQLKESEFLQKNDSLPFVNSSYSHNDYLQILSETGVIGIILFISLIFFVFYKIEKNILFYNNTDYIFIICISCSILFIIIESVFNFPLFIFPSCMLFYFFLGLLNSNLFINKSVFKYYAKSKLIIIIILLPLIFIFMKDIKKFTANIYLSSAIKQTYSNTEKAEILFKKSISLDLKNYYNLINFAIFYFNEKKYDLSLKYFNTALLFSPNSADIYYNIGVIYEQNKEYKKSLNNYKMALFFYPGFAPANYAVYRILSQINSDNENDYLYFLYRAVKSDPDLIKQKNISPFLLKEATFEFIN